MTYIKTLAAALALAITFTASAHANRAADAYFGCIIGTTASTLRHTPTSVTPEIWSKAAHAAYSVALGKCDKLRRKVRDENLHDLDAEIDSTLDALTSGMLQGNIAAEGDPDPGTEAAEDHENMKAEK